MKLTPEQQKLAADYHKFASITASKFKHKAPFDELFSACQLMLCKSAANYDPADPSQASFKTYLIRNLRWACQKVIDLERQRYNRTLQLSIDVTDHRVDQEEETEFDEPTPADRLTDLINDYAPTENIRQTMLVRMTEKSDETAGKRLGITKSRVHQIRARFTSVVRSRLMLEVA